jgi:hypothetical protein
MKVPIPQFLFVIILIMVPSTSHVSIIDRENRKYIQSIDGRTTWTRVQRLWNDEKLRI